MKIGIDGRVLDRQMTGTGRYLKNLLEGIPKVDTENEYYIFLNDDSLIDTNFYKQVKVKESRLPDKLYSSYWLNFILPSEAKQLGLDIFFTCNIILPIVSLGSTKKVTVIHDIIQKAEPKFYPFSYRLYLNFLIPLTIKNASTVITASKYSKKDLKKFYPSSVNKTEVLYTSAQKEFKPRELKSEEINHLEQKYGLNKKIALYVGVIEKRKNIDGLFSVAEKISEKNLDLQIVLVGRKGFGFENIEERTQNTNASIKYINFVEEEDLPLLYNLAHLFLFPSYYEGFGIPPLEAMQSGTPVITSNRTSLSEILGDAAIMVEPDDVNSIVNEIEKLIVDSDYYSEYQKRGLTKASEYDFVKSTEKLVHIFNKFDS